MSEVQISTDDAKRIAQYVATTDAVLTKQAGVDAIIPQAVDVLVARGAVQADARAVKLAEFQADPAKLIVAFTKLANVVPAIGAPATPAAPASKKSAADIAYENELES